MERGQFWTLEHSPSHCSSGQFWTRTISPVDSPPFQFGNTSHWFLDSYQPQWTLLNPCPPPTSSQGGAVPPPPRRLINYRKSMFLCRKNLQFVPHIPLVEGGGVMKSYTRSSTPPHRTCPVTPHKQPITIKKDWIPLKLLLNGPACTEWFTYVQWTLMDPRPPLPLDRGWGAGGQGPLPSEDL